MHRKKHPKRLVLNKLLPAAKYFHFFERTVPENPYYWARVTTAHTRKGKRPSHKPCRATSKVIRRANCQFDMPELTNITYNPRLSAIQGAALYQELRRKLIEANLFERAYGFYALHALGVLLLMAVTLFFLFSVENPFLFGLLAVLLAFCASQLGGYMHDAAHRMIFKTERMNNFVGTLAATIIFLNFNAWKRKHSAHHAHPNQEGADPDLDIPLISFTEARYATKEGIERALQGYQAILYTPMLCFLTYSLQFKNSIRHFIRELQKGCRLSVAGEFALFLIGFSLWYVLPFLVFDLLKALLFITIVPIGSGLYIGSVFAPNHKGMPVLARDMKLSFLEQQIITSRNLADHWFTDFIYLGLNYQIEHHLYPEVARNKLKYVTPYVTQLCLEHDLPYTIIDLPRAMALIPSELAKVVRAAESARYKT